MNLSWKAQGSCYGHPEPDLWFPADGRKRGTFKAAQAICEQCPVRDLCRQYAEKVGVSDGVWAGVNRSKRPVSTAVPPPHGTEARARRHRKAGEKPCDFCLEGEREARAARRPA